MNAYFLGVILVLASAGDYPSPNSRRSEQLVLSADKVVIRGEDDKPETGVVVTDRAWIEHMGKALGRIPLDRAVECMCEGWRTAYFYDHGALVYSIAAIHGNQLRAHSVRGGGDFPVSEGDWKAISDLIKEKAGG